VYSFILIFFIISLSYSQTIVAQLNDKIDIDNKSNNIFGIDTSSNASKIEIILKNNQSKDNAVEPTQVYGILTTIVGASGAIGGGIIATYLTYYFSKRKELDEEKRFNANIRELVQHELEFTLSFINSFKEEDQLSQDDISGFLALPNQYLKMSLEKRATVFTKESLSKVEKAYGFIIILRSFIKPELGKSKISFKDLSNKVGMNTLKNSLMDAISSIRNEQKAL
jgi:hypothetical protein